jgi:hypothetical protein
VNHRVLEAVLSPYTALPACAPQLRAWGNLGCALHRPDGAPRSPASTRCYSRRHTPCSPSRSCAARFPPEPIAQKSSHQSGAKHTTAFRYAPPTPPRSCMRTMKVPTAKGCTSARSRRRKGTIAPSTLSSYTRGPGAHAAIASRSPPPLPCGAEHTGKRAAEDATVRMSMLSISHRKAPGTGYVNPCAGCTGGILCHN